MDSRNIFGGNPLAVIIRLAVLSVIVGIVLSALGIHPRELVYHLRRLGHRLVELGFPALEHSLDYMMLGAVIVVPIWLLARLIGIFGSRGGDGRR